jgi:hypothetical protein
MSFEKTTTATAIGELRLAPHLDRMKIFFAVTTKGHGRGGHFYSLRATADALSSFAQVTIVNFGVTLSPILRGACGQLIDLSGRGSIGNAVGKFQKLVFSEKPDVIHSFDLESLYFSREAALLCKVPLVHTRCGGANPRRYFPLLRNLIVYSKENAAYFAASRRHGKTKTHLIPNRVSEVHRDQERIASLRARQEPNTVTFLRISRIGEYYRRSLLGSARLVSQLNLRGVRARLLVVGVIQSEAVAADVLSESSGYARIVSEDRYTQDAAQLIDIAEFVIGTGRGFMEAAMCGKIVLAPLQNREIPYVATLERLPEFFRQNFSERVILEKTDSEGDELQRIVELCAHSSVRDDLLANVKKYAREHFDVDAAKELHRDVYSSLQRSEPAAPFDRLLHRLIVARSFRAARKAAQL